MKKITFFSLIILIAYTTSSFGQNSGDTFGDHMRYGGSFNLGFSNNYTTIGISPSAIYDFYNGFATGLSLSYYYTDDKLYHINSNVYGGSIITLYNPLPYLQLSAELEELNVNFEDNFFNYSDSYWNTALYFGLAYSSRNVSVGFRFDVLYDEVKSIYGSSISPVFRVYF